MSRLEIIKLINSFLDGSINDWAWDDFTSVRQKDSESEAVRQKIFEIELQYPAAKRDPITKLGPWCSDGGIAALEQLSARLKQENW